MSEVKNSKSEHQVHEENKADQEQKQKQVQEIVIEKQEKQNGDQIKAKQNQINKEIQYLKEKILREIPDMEEQIKEMDKKDLLDVIKQIQKQKKKQLIIQKCPQMKDQIEILGENDIQQIFQTLNGQKLQTSQQVQHQVSGGPSKQKILPIATQKQPQPQQFQLNVIQMKKSLIDRLPQYRSQIKQLSDDQIRNMFYELQEQDAQKNKRNAQKTKIQDINGKNKQKRNEIEIDSQSQGYSKDSKQTNNINTFPKSKKENIQFKKNSKCKITFYLEPEDFQQAQGTLSAAQEQKLGLARIIQALGRAFSK